MKNIKEIFASELILTQKTVVTPEVAKSILENCNTNNRPIKRNNVDFLVREMKNGSWHFDGSPIRFLQDGTLADGQHRLLAIVESGVPQEMLFLLGLPSEAVKSIDICAKRTAKDNLIINTGLNYQNSIMGAINQACGGAVSTIRLSTNDQEKFIKKYKRYVDLIASLGNVKKITIAPVLGAILKALIAGENEQTVRDFCTVLLGNKIFDLTPGEASVRTLRDKLLATLYTRTRDTNQSAMKITERVFVAYLSDEYLQRLRIPNEFVYDFVDIGSLYNKEG